LTKVAKLVELGVVAPADGPAIGQVHRRVIGDRPQDQVAHLSDFIEPVIEVAQPRRLLRLEAAFESRDLFERPPQGEYIARPRHAQRHFRKQALQVEDALQFAPDLGPQDGLLQHLAHRVQAQLDLRGVHGGPQQPLPQQPPPHAGLGLVEHSQQGGTLPE